MSDGTVELDGEDAMTYASFVQARRELAKARAEYDETREALLKLMEHATVALVDGKPVARVSRHTADRFDQARFRADNPRMYANYVVPSKEIATITLVGGP